MSKDRCWKSKARNSRVIKTAPYARKGFYAISDGSMEGYNKMNARVIEDQFEECSEEHYKKFRYTKETY